MSDVNMGDGYGTHYVGDGCDPPHGCARCEKPFAPYGVAVPTGEVDAYCWRDHEVRDLRDAVAHALDCRVAGCQRCLDLRALVEAG